MLAIKVAPLKTPRVPPTLGIAPLKTPRVPPTLGVFPRRNPRGAFFYLIINYDIV
jgi:hypothetical protein